MTDTRTGTSTATQVQTNVRVTHFPINSQEVVDSFFRDANTLVDTGNSYDICYYGDMGAFFILVTWHESTWSWTLTLVLS